MVHGKICACGQGYVSAYDGKCGYCRTAKERRKHLQLVNSKDTTMNDILLQQPGALAEIPFSIEDMEADAKLGGQLELADISIPYLYILQSNSPQTNLDHPKYIQGATAGMLYLTNLEKVYDGRTKGLQIVPCYYERLVTEWLPREAGGGLVASHEPEADILKNARPDEKNRPTLPNGHQLVETAYHYVLVQDPVSGTWYQAIAPFKSTALRASRRMNSTISTTTIPGTNKKAPRFLYKWLMNSVKEQKDDYVWSAPKLTQLDMVSADVYSAAKNYAIVAAKGLLRRVAIEAEMETTDEGEIKPRRQSKPDDEIPF
jgi:hypothetical protein